MWRVVFCCVVMCIGTAFATSDNVGQIDKYFQIITDAGWGNQDDDVPERKEIYDKVSVLVSQRDENTAELEENAQAMRDKEQSTANKLIGAAGIGAGGIGGMMLASGMAEQNADADAETAMWAYLATFTCNYGAGKNVAGGTENVELPGGNELIGLYTEYVTLANDLKRRKAELGMAPGIESEPILESATSGLYDDVATGKTSGAYASLARALMAPEGEDAKTWAAQKEESAKNVKTGAITAGVGAVVGIVGNAIINHDNKNRVDEILRNRDKIESELVTLMNDVVKQCNSEIDEHIVLVNKIKMSYPNWASNSVLKEYVTDISAVQRLNQIEDIIKIKDMPVCH